MLPTIANAILVLRSAATTDCGHQAPVMRAAAAIRRFSQRRLAGYAAAALACCGCTPYAVRDWGAGKCVEATPWFGCPNRQFERCHFDARGCRVCVCDDGHGRAEPL